MEKFKFKQKIVSEQSWVVKVFHWKVEFHGMQSACELNI